MILSGSYKDNLLVQDTSPVPYIGYAKVCKVSHISSLDVALEPHSVSIGAAHHAAAMGVPEDKIRRFGRWVFRLRSGATYVCRCCRYEWCGVNVVVLSPH